MKKLAIGVSTLNDGILNLLNLRDKIPEIFEVIICHQIDNGINYDVNLGSVIYYKCFQKGLSKSRNELLKIASNNDIDYLIISDDDVTFLVDSLNELNDYVQNINTDENIWFRSVDDAMVLRKKYPVKEGVIDWKLFFSVASIELCLNVKAISKNRLFFDESFGLGTDIPSGEEPIFISDCSNNGIKTKYLPINISIHPIESSGSDMYESVDSFSDRLLVFCRMFGKFKGFLLYVVFCGKNFRKVNFSFLILIRKTFFKYRVLNDFI
ncbi:hypothetical protein VXS02_03445 [Photobacterium piscicola]|uniref:hypothetical protein n=1 Tax=Photobacterium piscicola TaxID=1378299 RepID=UPI002E197B63|nr:hypothetical protein [Photobacterium piscicola]